MPVPRTCLYCRKTILTSTYGIINHLSKCSAVPDNIQTRLTVKKTLNKSTSHASNRKSLQNQPPSPTVSNES